ncbi:MAG: hypothetical protein LUG44_04905 [Clostridiales bacterium]|nr:hypothetical protein [Clostridiales bacterium]
MKIEKLSPSEALERGRALPFALVRCYSSVTLGKTPADVDTDQLLEARFFDATQEVRLFRQAGGLRAVACEQEAGDDFLEERYKLANQDRFGETLTVRYDLSADEDGQTYVASTRLAGWQGGESK